jgi:hypothetical protein
MLIIELFVSQFFLGQDKSAVVYNANEPNKKIDENKRTRKIPTKEGKLTSLLALYS